MEKQKPNECPPTIQRSPTLVDLVKSMAKTVKYIQFLLYSNCPFGLVGPAVPFYELCNILSIDGINHIYTYS